MFSFIVPAYNEEKYIEDCLNSIYAVDGFGDSEVIVVDNASNDKTAEIVKTKFAHAKLIQESRKGTGWAREVGFRASRGDFLAFIDADNQLPKDWLNLANKLIDSHKKYVAFSGPYIQDVIKTYGSFVYNLFYIPIAGVMDFLGLGGILFGGNMLIKRFALEKIGGFDTHIVFWGDDTLIAKRLRKIGRISFSNRLYVYSSGRRLQKQGLVRSGLLYLLNGFWVVIFNKPFHNTYKPYR